MICKSSPKAPSSTDESMDEYTSVLSLGSISIVLNSEKQIETFQHITGGQSRTCLVWLQHSLLHILSSGATFLIVRAEPTPNDKQNPRPLNYESCSMAQAFICQPVTTGLGSIPAQFIWVYGRHCGTGTGSSLSTFFFKLKHHSFNTLYWYLIHLPSMIHNIRKCQQNYRKILRKLST